MTNKDINYSAYYFAKQKERQDKNRQRQTLMTIHSRIKNEASALSHMPEGSEKKIDLLRNIPGVRYADLAAMRSDLMRIAENRQEWQPLKVKVSYDYVGNTFTLKKE